MQSSNWGDLFQYVGMKDLARFLTTFNMVSQQIAVDGVNVYSIQSTGLQDCTINGVYIPALPADAELIINTDQAAPTDEWDLLAAAGVTTCAVDDEVYTGTLQGVDQKFYKCLVAHDLRYGTEPAENPQLWQALPNLDEMELTDDFRLWIMVTAESDGTLGCWIASDAHVAIGTTPTLKIPYFDPSVYCVVAIIDYRNDAAATVTFGEAAGNGTFTDTDDAWIQQVVGPVFPHPDFLPKN